MNVDWGRSGRRDDYSFFRVDPFTLQETGETIEVVSGSNNVTWSLSSENYVSASLHLFRTTDADKLIRIKHTITLPDGYQESETLGTFFVDYSEADAKYGAVDRQANCYSTLMRFTDDVLAQDFVRPAGTNIIGEVRDLVTADGGRLVVDTTVDTDRQHTVGVWFQAGTNRAQVLRQIADWTGCVLGVDDLGNITWSKYVPPEQRPQKAILDAVYLPGFHISTNSADTVNRVVAQFSRQSKQDGDPYPLADSAYVDLPAEHPYSYGHIGRRKAHYLSVGDPCSHDELVAQANRYLEEHAGGVDWYQVEHVGIPGLRPGHIVLWSGSNDASHNFGAVCLVEEISMELGPGAMCKTKLRAVGYAKQS